MKLLTRLVFALLPAAALAAASPPVLASVAPAPHAGSSVVTTGHNGRSVAISMRPGTHTVSETMPISAQPGFTGTRSAQAVSQGDRSGSGAIRLTAAGPEIQVRVGKNNCGGFNGTESIYISGYDMSPGGGYGFPLWAVKVWGIEWDNCNY